MATVVLNSVQDCSDLAFGLVLLGTGGGGGTPQMTIEQLSQELKAGRRIELADIADLPEDSWTVTVAGMGARPASGEETAAAIARLGLAEEKYPWLDRLAAAVEELVDYAGVELGAIVPGEIGCFNTTGPIVAGMRLGVPVVDGDYAGGRAVPEVGQMIPEVFGVPLYPMAFVDRWGDVCLLKESYNSAMADRIGRMLCRASFEGVGAAWYLLQARQANKVVARGSLTRALTLGRARREALENGSDPVQAIIQCTDGWLLFKGTVLEANKDIRSQTAAFNTGTHFFDGIEEFGGEKLEIWYKNENHICWRNGEPYATSPDLICIADLKTGVGKTTYEVSPGQRVAVIGIKANRFHRTERGIEVLGPRHFGFDLDYVPIEEIFKA